MTNLFKKARQRRLLFFLGLFACCVAMVQAQGKKIEGTIIDAKGAPVSVGSINVGGTTQGVVFYNGKFSIDLPEGTVYFNVMAEGYEIEKVEVTTASSYKVVMSKPRMPENQSVKGIVYDNLKEPIVGATVIIQGTNQGTITDYNGEFNLQLPGDNTNIIVSFIGFDKQELNVAGKSNIEVILKSGIEDLDEVVIVGYGIQRKSDITGSVASVKSEELTKIAAVGVDQALQGRASGVQITSTSGKPGAGVDVQIRGIGTVGNSNPLYVVDGVPVETIEFINPGDIESLEILKDASATAIYGSRGANGVVLISTKKGSAKETIISYEGYFGWQTPINRLTLTDAEHYAIIRNEGRRADGLTPLAGMENPQQLGKGTDWIDEGFRQSPMHNHNVRVAGGSEKMTYNLSFNYFDQEGTIIESNFKRYSVRLNNTYKVKDWLTLGNNLTYVDFGGKGVYQQEGSGARVKDFYTATPLMAVKNADGSWGYDPHDLSAPNPVALFHLNNPENMGTQFIGNVFAQIDFTEGLMFKTTYGKNIFNNKVQVFEAAYEINPNQRNENSRLAEFSSLRESYVWTNTLSYLFDINKKHKFNAMIGHELQELKITDVTQSVSEIPDGLADSKFIGTGNVSTSSVAGVLSESALVSGFGRLNYNFDNRYLFTANFRADGSSRFGSSNRWGFFPSFAVGWNLYQESFLKDKEWLSQLKLRLGWGQIGNQKIGSYAFATRVDDGFRYYFGNPGSESSLNGKAPTMIGNPDIKWETTESSNIGVDLGLFNSRITLNADYFYKLTTDMLVQLPVFDYMGSFTNPFANAGEVENQGLELGLGVRGEKGKFSYEVTGNISFIRNKVLSLGAGGQPIVVNGISKTDVGQPIASFWGYQANGIFQTADEVNNYTNSEGLVIQPSARPGDIKYQDLNDDGKIDANDQNWIGSPHPDFFYGLNINFKYGQWDLSAMFQGTQGNDIYNGLASSMITGISNKPVYYFNERWTGPGSGNKYPRAAEVSGADNKLNSSLWIEDGSYLRLKNIQLGYNFDLKKENVLKISKLRLYVSAQNLFTITNYSGAEPEIGRKEKSVGFDYYNQNFTSIGRDGGVVAMPRTFIFGVNASF